MKSTRVERPPRGRAWWPWAVLATAAVIALGAGMSWWTPGASGGTPRLVVDREVIELGDLPFGTPAKAVFTLTNAGNGRLEIADDLRVKAVKGC